MWLGNLVRTQRCLQGLRGPEGVFQEAAGSKKPAALFPNFLFRAFTNNGFFSHSHFPISNLAGELAVTGYLLHVMPLRSTFLTILKESCTVEG